MLKDRIAELRDARTDVELIKQTEELLCSIGLEHFVFATIHEERGEIIRRVISQWPEGWFQNYYSRGFSQYNHFVDQMFQDRSGARIENFQIKKAEHHELMIMAREHGIISGAVVGSSESKDKLGMLYACSSDSTRGNNHHIDKHLPTLRILADSVYDNLERVNNLDMAASAAAGLNNSFRLTEEEIFCLMMASHGRDNNEVSQLLNVKLVTVKKYLETARRKLNARNTMHAAFILARNGIIE